MLFVTTTPSNIFTMTETDANMDDLEDGEIESDGDDVAENQETEQQGQPIVEENVSEEQNDKQEIYYSKSGKKKKSKSHKSDSKLKEKSKKSRKHGNPLEDDFAGNIEKAIRKAMKKTDDGNLNNDDMNVNDERRKHKKRKKYDGKDGPNKKRKKQDYSDEMDESEMMFVRGASPVQRQSSPTDAYQDDERDSFASDSSQDSRGNQNQRQGQRHRQIHRDRNKNSKNDRRRGRDSLQDPDGVCAYFMQGKCHKGDDCVFSHDAQPPRKMELCKFYLMECCAKRDKCLYMHADFPCKYYHTGLPCVYKDECKFAHGKPLSEGLKNILLKHIESAPKEILGDFPRLNREGALKMIQTTQAKLMQQYPECAENQEKNNIPSLFELHIPNPLNSTESFQINNFNNDRSSKVSPKVRQSRWQNESNTSKNYSQNHSPNSSTNTVNVLNIKNLTGVLTPRQISDLTKMGIENLDQLGRLTVLQLNSIGISLKQITEIQLNTMSIQKLGLIGSNSEQTPSSVTIATSSAKDLDLRVPPVVPLTDNTAVLSEFPGKDIDMRFQPPIKALTADESSPKPSNKDLQNKDMIDIDQYAKDALKFASKDKENIDISNETLDEEKTLPSEIKDVDHRVLPFSEEDHKNLVSNDDHQLTTRYLFNQTKSSDTDIRFLQPEATFKSPEKRHRRSTTDDEDNNLLIDEKWYSSDEEKGCKKKVSSSPVSSPKTSIHTEDMSLQAPMPHVIEPTSVLSKLGDLSKIDISEEVTKLLNTMKNNLTENKLENTSDGADTTKIRDPRCQRSPENTESHKSVKKSSRISIYECIDGEPTDGRRRTDVDLRKTDYAVPGFGDTDLRQSASGDIDFRLGLPFKAIPNYTPASEIDGSINSHPPIPFKLVPIHIPRPDYTDIRNSTAKSQALVDPRLRKVFRLSVDESNSDSEKPSKPVTPSGPRIDPRRKSQNMSETSNQEQKDNSLDLQAVLLSSNWYKELSSTQKIFVNQNLAPVTQMIKQYQQEKSTGKKFDVVPIQNNSVLCSIFTNLGISLNDNGEFAYLPKPKEALLKTPISFNQNAGPFGNVSGPVGPMDPNNRNMLNVPPMGLNNMNNVGQMYNQPFSDPRGGPTPGLLGIAPNIPHNFANNNYGGPNNFGNMPFNGQGNDFHFMDGDQNYPRFPNRGGHRGRGNDRWNRGGLGRGQRDRKNFHDRGSWKNDRH